MSTLLPIAQPIKTTSSLCPVCLAQVPAEVFERDGQVFLAKHCAEHGRFEVLINADRRFYYPSLGADRGDDGSHCCGSTGCCEPAGSTDHAGGHDASLIERASTCIALIEIVESCNLSCPTCYADSPFAEPGDHQALPVAEFWQRIYAVLDRKGPLDILQLSGGEPTLHPQFFELLEGVLRDERIGYTLLNTNGVRLARDEPFMRRLGQLRRQYRKLEVYLQFDGPQADGQMELRGADLRRMREQAIDRCGAQGVPVTLAMIVHHHNQAALGETLRFGLARPIVRGITFQPMFGSGRLPVEASPLTVEGHDLPVPPRRLNVADVIHSLIDQSDGLLTARDFTPLPCGDPNCHTIGYLLRRGDQTVRISELIDFANLQGFLRERANFSIADLEQCGCESEALGHVLKVLEIGPDNVFRLFIKPFMDAWTYDQHRIDRCCVHVVGEGGRLESFCRHYAMKAGGCG